VSCSRRRIPAEPDADPVDHSDQKNAAALRADGDPEIALVVKEPHQTKNNGGGWHTDHSYDQQPGRSDRSSAHERCRARAATPYSPALSG
jgi:alpha-ketoglutarate-dependent taurine dioxygenase